MKYLGVNDMFRLIHHGEVECDRCKDSIDPKLMLEAVSLPDQNGKRVKDTIYLCMRCCRSLFIFLHVHTGIFPTEDLKK